MASQEYHKFIGMNVQDRMHAAAQMTPNEQSTIMREAARVTTGIKEFMPGTANQAVAVIRSGSFIDVDGHLAEGIAKILSVNGTGYLCLEQYSEQFPLGTVFGTVSAWNSIFRHIECHYRRKEK